MAKVDAFAHALPKAFAHEMLERNPEHGIAGLMDAQQLWDLENRITDLDDFGIDRQVLTLARPSIWRGLSPADAIALTRLANDGICEMAAEHPDRLIPVATLPFLTDVYIEEFDRCIEDLGVTGVQIFTSSEGRPIDDPKFDPLFEQAAKFDVPIWLHPRSRDWFDWPDEYDVDNMFGWPFDTSAAIARLVLSGVFDRHPDLKLIAHHLGGVIPHLQGRLRSIAVRAGYDIESVFESLRGTYVDTATKGSVNTLECGYEFYGPDSIVFGTDYPFGPERGRAFLRETVACVDEMDVSTDVRARIYEKNIENLL